MRNPPRTPVEAPLPSTRAELLQLHVAARQRRDASPLGSDDYRSAAEEVARIEIQVARIEEPTPAG